MSARPLQVGDLCITVNAKYEINNGALVVITDINATVKDGRGEATPYLIRRVDGQPHPNTTNTATGAPIWYRTMEASCPGRKLRRVDDGEQQDVNVKGVEEETRVLEGVQQ